MQAFSVLLALAAPALEGTLLLRGKRQGLFDRFPLFFSYIAFAFAWSAGAQLLFRVWLDYYVSVFWYLYLLKLVVEFAVLIEISDQLFRPFPAIALLGRLVNLSLTVVLFAFYILPALVEPKGGALTVLDLVKRTSLAKALIIVALLAAARLYGLPFGRTVAGLMLGLVFHLAINVANFALAETYGRDLYGGVFAVVGPLSYVITMAIWTQAMWRYEPARLVAAARPAPEAGDLDAQLGKFDSALARLLRR
jgi:hypothetical protein